MSGQRVYDLAWISSRDHRTDAACIMHVIIMTDQGHMPWPATASWPVSITLYQAAVTNADVTDEDLDAVDWQWTD